MYRKQSHGSIKSREQKQKQKQTLTLSHLDCYRRDAPDMDVTLHAQLPVLIDPLQQPVLQRLVGSPCPARGRFALCMEAAVTADVGPPGRDVSDGFVAPENDFPLPP